MFDFNSIDTFWSVKQILNNELIFLLTISFIGLFDVYKKYFNLFPKFKIVYLFSCFILSLIIFHSVHLTHLFFLDFNEKIKIFNFSILF